MARRLFLCAPICVAIAVRTAAAQRGSEARLILTMSAGSTISQPSLWTIARQPLLVLGTENDPQPLYDTVNLARGFGTNLIVGVAGAYFPTPSVGIELSATWLGLTTETSCTGVAFDSLLGGSNRDMCTAIQGSNHSLGAIAFFVNLEARATPRAAISPYVRAGAGLTTYSVSTIYVEGPVASGIRIVVDDPSPQRNAVSLTVGAGLTVALGPGYRFRFDLGDALVDFEHLTGPADRLAVAPRGSGLTHHLTLSMGLGIVLEAKRGRRY